MKNFPPGFWLGAIKWCWRYWIVSKTVSNVMKGIGAGMAAGIAVGVVSSAIMSGSRRARKGGHRAMRAVEDLLTNVSYMMK